ncbi:hypothetical protein, partial [Pseudomonas sp. K5]|uniref:hypothetical protein n=1 Tax=Pseudomonas sp. K5 TaxID=1156313 RepID=UPI00186761D3
MKYVPFLIGGALLLWAILFGVQRMDAARRGVCGEQQRILDPAEIKQAAVRHELKTFPPSVPVNLEDLGEGRSVQTWAVPANAVADSSRHTRPASQPMPLLIPCFLLPLRLTPSPCRPAPPRTPRSVPV